MKDSLHRRPDIELTHDQTSREPAIGSEIGVARAIVDQAAQQRLQRARTRP